MFLSKILKAADHPYLFGKGGRMENNSKMQGTSMASLRHHSALKPLFIIIGGGMFFVGLYVFRLASKTTDINWRKTKDPSEPMEYYANRQFKFLNPQGIDYANINADRPRPKITED